MKLMSTRDILIQILNYPIEVVEAVLDKFVEERILDYSIKDSNS